MPVETVPEALAGERVDRVVAFVCGCSRSEATALVADGHVRSNRRRVKKGSERVEAGDVLDIDDAPLSTEQALVAEPDLHVSVLHVDDEVIVVDKPAGIVVHPGAGTPDGTLIQGLLARFPELAAVGEPDRPGVVHRLDRGTTGVLVVARTDAAHAHLSAQLAAHSMDRRYLAVVDGHLATDRGVIDAALGRSRRHPTRRAVVTDGKPARTHYEVRSRHDAPVAASVVTCRLETGRTHQIRVHLSAIGHPVMGDGTYGRRSPLIARPALHAEVLAFTHPGTDERLEFRSEPPADLTELIAGLA